MRTALIIDDVEYMRNVLREGLSKQGYNVIAADNGQRGVEMYSEFKPDVTLMDITMPVMHGVDALTEILRIDPDAKVAMVTACDKPEMIEQCKAIGAADYITKPFKIEELVAKINAL